MSELDDLRHRVEALEAAVRGIDRDQSDNTAAIRATHHLVQALAFTQGEHTATLAEHGEQLVAMRAQLTTLAGGQQTIVGLLTQLIEREG